ncbi:hypothetical protein KFE98_17890 [bacterium SCSIO 12741]|nr:hypothetical protein KFE98_17890 [bacterium SCSIO 12741]
MNPISRLLVGLLLFIGVSGMAQNSPKIQIGGGLNYALKLNTSGINGRAYLRLGDHLRAGPEFTKFLKRTHSGSFQNEDHDAFEINFVVHGMLYTSDFAGVYGSGGYSFFSERITKQQTGESSNQTWHGAKLGAGGFLETGPSTFFLEYHYILGGADDHVVTIGYLFGF